MKTIFLVEQKDADKARSIEAKLVGLPQECGILFAGVRVAPVDPNSTAIENKPLFQLTVGCSRDFEEATIDALVRMVLKAEIEAGMWLSVDVRRGISRSVSVKVDAT